MPSHPHDARIPIRTSRSDLLSATGDVFRFLHFLVIANSLRDGMISFVMSGGSSLLSLSLGSLTWWLLRLRQGAGER